MMKKTTLLLLSIFSNYSLLIAQSNIQWQRSIGGSFDDVATFVRQTSDGGYIIAGYSNSNDVNVTGNHGNFDYWIVKLKSTNSIEWEKSLGDREMIKLIVFKKPRMADIL